MVDVAALINAVDTNPKVCGSSKIFFGSKADYPSLWAALIGNSDPVDAYAWIHLALGKSTRLTSCILTLFGSFQAMFSPNALGWFNTVNTHDSLSGNPPAFVTDNSFSLTDRFLARGMSLIFSPSMGDSLNYMDTANCIGCLSQAVLANNVSDAKVQKDEHLVFRKTAMDLLLAEFPNGD